MENTDSKELLKRADLIAPNNDHDGVAKMLIKLIPEDLL